MRVIPKQQLDRDLGMEENIVTDAERIDFVERISLEATRRLLGHAFKGIGFIVTESGDVLSGNNIDYPHKTLRKAIDARQQGGIDAKIFERERDGLLRINGIRAMGLAALLSRLARSQSHGDAGSGI